MSQEVGLETLLAEREILRTMYQYSQAIDYDLEDEYVDCFTEDATFDAVGAVLSESVNRRRAGIHGREALRTFIKSRGLAFKENGEVVFQKHIPAVPLIEVDGERATVISHFVGFDAEKGLPVVRDLGRYRDVFVKCADGRWRIKERIFEAEAFRSIPGEHLMGALDGNSE